MPTSRFILPKNITIHLLLNEVKKYASPGEVDLVQIAYDFAAKAHEGQKRASGEPYVVHPLSAAYILSLMKIDAQILVATLLHDVPEDTTVTLEDIEHNFGADIASMVRGITKLGKLKYRGVDRYIENLRKMFVAMAEDVRVMIVKFADRTHNLMTLDALAPQKRYRIALESMEIFAPIANRLGMGEFRGLLEDLSFPHIFPKEYEQTKKIYEQLISHNADYLEKLIQELKEELNKNNIPFYDVHGRQKQLYSFYQKLKRKDGDASKVYDIVAIRIIVPNISDCYAALGTVHKLWKPLKGRIKDYIAQPKPNGYQSLHTTVFGDNGMIVEFQIRTPEIHNEAEYGIAAHWHYDERGSRLPKRDIQWARELANIQKEILNNLSDLEEMKVDFFQSRIFVFTPKGDVIDLPDEATPIDFAYHIHTEIGNHCSGAKVNDQLASLDTPLKSGDVIEILVDKNRKGPSQDWLKIAKTQQAKSKIKASLNINFKGWLKTIISR